MAIDFRFRITLPVRKISFCNRVKRFLSLYWKSMIVVLTPLVLLPIIILNEVGQEKTQPVSVELPHA